MHLNPVPDPPEPRSSTAEEPSIAELERQATILRINCVRMLAVAKSGHLDSSLSAADIVAALYYRELRHDPQNPGWPERDRFVLSKGHAAPIQYAALAEHGYFPRQDLMGLRKIGHQLQGHPDMTRTRGSRSRPVRWARDFRCARICLALRLDGLDETAQVFGLLSDGDARRARPGGRPRRPLQDPEPDGDHRLQPPADRRHHRGSHGHRRRAREVRGVRLGLGRDRGARHGRRSSRRWSAAARSSHPAAIICQTKKGRGRLFDGGPLRLPRQAGQPGAGGRGAGGARGKALASRDEAAARRGDRERRRPAREASKRSRDRAARPEGLRRRPLDARAKRTRTSSRSTPICGLDPVR